MIKFNGGFWLSKDAPFGGFPSFGESSSPSPEPVEPINLLAEALDSRVTYIGPAHAYRNNSGGLSQSAVNVWPLEYVNGVAVGRHLPESAATNIIPDTRFATLGSGTVWNMSTPPATALSTGTAIDGGDGVQVPTGYVNPAIYNGSTFIVPDTTAWVNKTLDNSWIRKSVTGTFAAASPNARYYIGRQSSTQYLYAIASSPVGLVTLSEIRKALNASNDVICIPQAEAGGLATSPILSGSVRAASSVMVANDGDSTAIRIHFNNSETIDILFNGAQSVNVPVSTVNWATKYITQIEYI